MVFLAVKKFLVLCAENLFFLGSIRKRVAGYVLTKIVQVFIILCKVQTTKQKESVQLKNSFLIYVDLNVNGVYMQFIRCCMFTIKIGTEKIIRLKI